MGRVLRFQQGPPGALDLDGIEPFRSWWNAQDENVRAAVRRIVTGEHDATEETAAALLEFLNQKTGKKFRPVDENLSLIRARLRSGVTPGDVRAVIAAKARQWNNDPKMRAYLRPATLFAASNFEQYLGELGGE